MSARVDSFGMGCHTLSEPCQKIESQGGAMPERHRYGSAPQTEGAGLRIRHRFETRCSLLIDLHFVDLGRHWISRI